MMDDRLSERECWQAMDAMFEHIARVEWELFKSDFAGIVMTIAAFLVGALLF